MTSSRWPGIRCIDLLAVAVTAVCSGCASVLPPAPGAPGAPQPIELTDAVVTAQPLGRVPNCGALVPIVSPDGKWIIGLVDDAGDMIDPASLSSGRRLEHVALWLRSTEPNAPLKRIARSGAAWPTWSADSSAVIFVSYDRERQCSLVIYNVADGVTRRVRVGLRHMMMPAASPSGKRVVVVTYDHVPQHTRLVVIDLASLKVTRVPHHDGRGAQLWPQWVDDHTLAFLLFDDDAAFVKVWSDNTSGVTTPIARLAVPTGESFEPTQLLTGIARPLSPDGAHLACYDALADRVVVVNLSDGQKTLLPEHTRGGAWVATNVLAAATDQSAGLFAIDSDQRADLLQGAFLPRWSDARGRRLILLGRDNDPNMFQLIRVRRGG